MALTVPPSKHPGTKVSNLTLLARWGLEVTGTHLKTARPPSSLQNVNNHRLE